ncbi:MAG: cytochrome b/b6 domain-containing protein, partial [Gammaproteobacteria bacterium]
DFFESGPLASYVSEDWNSRMSGFHHDLSEILLILVALHVAAVFFYLIWKRENLIRPMITGMKWVKRSRGGD